MGMYLNPGKELFEEAIRSEIFVDKTEMILYLNSVLRTKQKYVSVSRPRRFGKTMAADMLCAYYGRGADSREMFEKTLLAGNHAAEANYGITWDAYLGAFNVIRITMTDFIRKNEKVEDSLKRLSQRLMRELSREYPEAEYDPEDFIFSMGEFRQCSGAQFVIIIDEWDAIFRIRKEDKEGQTEYLNFLRNWLKDKEYVALAYMTGILPIKKYGEHSALNMFGEYSMIAPMQLARFTGFTEDEVKNLCSQYGRNFEKIKDWYDGYIVSDVIPPAPDHQRKSNGADGSVEDVSAGTGSGEARQNEAEKSHRYALYSPLSVVNAVSTGHIMNYWNGTESYEALAEYIRRDYDGLKDAVALLMNGGRLKVDVSTYQNDMTTFHSKDDVFALLIHLGYLGYDDETGEVFIPNKEILDVFKASTKSSEWVSTFRSFELSQEILKATWACDAEKSGRACREGT